MDLFKNLKRFFEELKDTKNITATSIANSLNISKKTLSNYINGDAYIPLEHLNSISNILDTPIDYILGFSNKSHNKNIKKVELLNPIEIGTSKNLILTISLYTICKKYNISADYLLGKSDFPIYLNSK